MFIRHLSILVAGLLLICATALADAPLKTALGLNVDQAREVAEIQAKHRRLFAAKRQERNRELRKLRRARVENDSKTTAEQEKITEKLLGDLRQIRASEDQEIRKLLNPEQREKFEVYIKQRKDMVGSSRDDKDL